MSSNTPSEILAESRDEGERRLARSPTGLVATGIVGGIDVMLGITALVVTAGALHLIMPADLAHVLASATFGIGFVLLLIGRSELFTENFMVPVSAVLARRASAGDLGRLWAGTLIGNLLALLALAWILTRSGLVPPEALDAGRRLADTFAVRDAGPAFLSAVLAGTVMTLMTWLAHATRDDAAKVMIALIIGFLLAAPSLNHAVVSFGEMSFGIIAGADAADWDDLLQNFPIAVLGNLIGGLGFVTLARSVQVYGDPE